MLLFWDFGRTTPLPKYFVYILHVYHHLNACTLYMTRRIVRHSAFSCYHCVNSVFYLYFATLAIWLPQFELIPVFDLLVIWFRGSWNKPEFPDAIKNWFTYIELSLKSKEARAMNIQFQPHFQLQVFVLLSPNRCDCCWPFMPPVNVCGEILKWRKKFVCVCLCLICNKCWIKQRLSSSSLRLSIFTK